MPDTPLLPGEPISPRDGEIKWFEPVIDAPAATPPASGDGDSAAARRTSVPWREMRWVGFGGDSEPDEAAADSSAQPPTAPDADAADAAPPEPLALRVDPDEPAVPPAPSGGGGLRRRLRVLLRVGAAATSVSVLAIFAYHNSEQLAGFAGVMPRPAPPVAAAPPLGLQQGAGATAAAPQGAADRAARYRTQAEAGDPAAQYNLAVLYLRGDGVVRDLVSAASWFRKAAEKGNAAAQFDLAVMFDRGLGVPRDTDEAIRWYRRAAERNYAPAQYNLALIYAAARGVPQDWPTAARWYRRAAVQGLLPAMVNYAILCESAEGRDRSAAEAYAWYRAAARRGDDAAAKRAGELFEQFAGAEKGQAVMKAAAVAASLGEPAPPPATLATETVDAPQPMLLMQAGGRKPGSARD